MVSILRDPLAGALLKEETIVSLGALHHLGGDDFLY